MWTLLLAVGLAWVPLSLIAGVVIGRSVRLADERFPGRGAQRPLTPAAFVS